MGKTTLFIFIAVFVFNCNGKKTESGTGVAGSPTFELYNGDTINRMDANGLKQGVWIRFEHTSVTKIKDTVVYKDNVPVRK
jgi:hypothetical protein